jgi:hypothetical protein
VQALNILPVLLEKGDQEVDAQHNVGKRLVISHLNVTNGNTQAENLYPKL